MSPPRPPIVADVVGDLSDQRHKHSRLRGNSASSLHAAVSLFAGGSPVPFQGRLASVAEVRTQVGRSRQAPPMQPKCMEKSLGLVPPYVLRDARESASAVAQFVSAAQVRRQMDPLYATPQKGVALPKSTGSSQRNDSRKLFATEGKPRLPKGSPLAAHNEPDAMATVPSARGSLEILAARHVEVAMPAIVQDIAPMSTTLAADAFKRKDVGIAAASVPTARLPLAPPWRAAPPWQSIDPHWEDSSPAWQVAMFAGKLAIEKRPFESPAVPTSAKTAAKASYVRPWLVQAKRDTKSSLMHTKSSVMRSR